jgi:UDP-N-acetylmuramate--alanine ligase
LFVSEVDESDGSIALFRPSVAVLNNISLDHKSMEELHRLFGDFLDCADHAVWNADDAESARLMSGKPQKGLSFGFAASAHMRASDVIEFPFASSFTLHCDGLQHAVRLQVPGRHNIANALAALAAVKLLGVPLDNAVAAVQGFTGLARRFDRVGETGGVTVIDDFGHNPDKIRATLSTMKAFPGRILAFFQPHGYGPIRVMGAELAEVLAEVLGPDDYILICDPVYFGGTVDRSIGAECITDKVVTAGRKAEHIPDRTDCGKRLLELAKPGDRIVIMGARDDTLSSFAREILAGLG